MIQCRSREHQHCRVKCLLVMVVLLIVVSPGLLMAHHHAVPALLVEASVTGDTHGAQDVPHDCHHDAPAVPVCAATLPQRTHHQPDGEDRPFSPMPALARAVFGGHVLAVQTLVDPSRYPHLPVYLATARLRL